MRKAIIVVVALLAIQGLLLLVWLGVERGRGDASMEAERLAGPAPELALTRAEDSELFLSSLRGSTVVLHFWATWCPPCREELPSLLDYASTTDARVLAVSVDPDWDAVRDFVGDRPPDPVYRATSDAVASAFGVEELPQTFVIDPSGELCLRFREARDWSSVAIRELVAGCRVR